MTGVARVHVACRRLDAPGQYAERADEVVPIASMYKVLLALEVADAFERGALRPETRVEVTPESRSPGGFGLTRFAYPAAVSLHDLMYMSLAWSDNTAADLLLDQVGVDAVHDRAARLGLASFWLAGSCRTLLGNAGADFGYPTDTDAELGDWSPLADASDLVLERTTRASVADLVELAARLDADEAAHPAACARVRELMAEQVWTFRFAQAFSSPDWTRASKTGTLSPWRGEFGIVTRRDGARFALAVAVRQHLVDTPPDAVDRAVAGAAWTAVQRSLDISNASG